MTRIHGRLTALAVKNTTKRGIYADGGGLYLQVARNGSRSWILRYRLGGRRRYCGLGSTLRVTLAEAQKAPPRPVRYSWRAMIRSPSSRASARQHISMRRVP